MKSPFLSVVVCLTALRPGLPAALTDWQTASKTGVTPAATYFLDEAGTAISGNAPILYNVGDFTDSRSFEFIVNAGNAGTSSSLMGLAGLQGLKFEQNNNTGRLGLTDYGVADNIADASPPLNEESQIVFTSDGADTLLYVNGGLRHTFTGVLLQLTGTVALGATMNAAAGAIVDRLDGHILGFTSYAGVLTPAQVTAHYQALIKDRKPVFLPAWQTAVTYGAVPPVQTLFQPVSGMAPALVSVGLLDGPRTFEFITYAGDAGTSGALLGRLSTQSLKFEQHNNTGSMGLTAYGVSDYNSGVPPPLLSLSQIAYVSDGSKTDLFVNGELQYTFDGVPLNLTGIQALGSAGNISGDTGVTTFRDPLDGEVLRFASYDRALTDAEVEAHHDSFAADAGEENFSAWQTAVAASSPSATRSEPAAGSAQATVDVGPLSGDRSFEFIVHAGTSTASGTLLGGNAQALKFEQWNNSGNIGLTVYGVSDFDSGLPSPSDVDSHIVYSSDGKDTRLYVDGVLQYTFTGTALSGAGVQGLATAAVLPVPSAIYFDKLDGHILGFASYADALSAEDLKDHYDALINGGTVVAPPPFTISAFSRNAATGAISLTWPSVAGQTFNITYGTDTAAFSGVVATGIPAEPGASSTAYTFDAPIPGAPRLFFRVLRQ